MEEQIIKLLSSLAAFNILDLQIVNIISDSFEVDAREICKCEGITYIIPSK